MKKLGTDPTVVAVAASLRSWLNANAGADPSVDDRTAALTVLGQLPSSRDQRDEPSAVRRVRAVCHALLEVCYGEDEAKIEHNVGQIRQWERDLAAMLRKYKGIAESAAAKRETYATIARMYGPRANSKAAAAFGFGPPDLYEALENCWREAESLAADAEAVTGYQVRRGPREQSSLIAATQHLRDGGFPRVEIVKLLPDGSTSTLEASLERVRNRLKLERRRILA
jgi:hypothetical protein